MAEIDIERRRGGKGWPWALAVLLLVLVVGLGWYFIAGPGSYESGLGPDEQPVETYPGAEPGPGGETPPGEIPPNR